MMFCHIGETSTKETSKFELCMHETIHAKDLNTQGSHFSRLTKFLDISMIFPGFKVNFQVFFHYC